MAGIHKQSHATSDSEVLGSLLVVVLEVHPGQKLLRDNTGVLSHCLNSVMAFCNSHLLLSPQNKLAVLASHASKSCFLYPSARKTQNEEVRSLDGKYELFTSINNVIEQEIKDLILKASHEEYHVESLLAGTLAMALCYINRIEKEEAGNGKLSCRILVLTASLEGASQYMNFMNVFFAAQKKNVVIDACILDKDVGLLQQGCDITGGIYLKIPQIAGLLQYLLMVFLPDVGLRKKINLPPAVPVDYRAACFCHRNLIEIGYVCSVCLSVFCTFSPICSTCESTFKLPDTLSMIAKKKKRPRLL